MGKNAMALKEIKSNEEPLPGGTPTPLVSSRTGMKSSTVSRSRSLVGNFTLPTPATIQRCSCACVYLLSSRSGNGAYLSSSLSPTYLGPKSMYMHTMAGEIRIADREGRLAERETSRNRPGGRL